MSIHRVGVICDPFVATGFRLAGLEPREATSPEAAVRALAELREEDTWGVLLVQEDLVEEIPPPSTVRARRGLPVVIPFPGPKPERAPGEAEAYVAELLRQAVGYRVRLR